MLNVHQLVTLLIAMMIQCLLYLKIFFSIRCYSFSAKGLTFSYFGIFSFLTESVKQITFSAFLASFVKVLSLSARLIFPEEFVLSEKKALIDFKDCHPQYLTLLKLVLTY